MYPDWLRWSRGGETGSALMLWLAVMERLELADLQTEEDEDGCEVRAPPSGENNTSEDGEDNTVLIG